MIACTGCLVIFWFVVKCISILHFAEINVLACFCAVMSSVVNFTIAGLDTSFKGVEVTEHLDGISFTTGIRINPVP